MDRQTDWVLESIKELRRAKSWTGRIHVQKLLFVVHALDLGTPPFRFALYHYGPYSRDLDETFAELEAFGLIARSYPQPGYGPQYDVSESINGSLEPSARIAIQSVATVFGEKDSQELERIATCLWVRRVERLTADEVIVNRVRTLKPHYAEFLIRQSLAEAKQAERQLSRGTHV